MEERNLRRDLPDGAGDGADNNAGGTPCFPGDIDNGIAADIPLAMVYSPKQYWRDLYDNAEALKRGTLFRELFFPWEAGEGTKE